MLTIGPVRDFKDHSQFKDLKDFNTNIEMFLAVHKKDFTPTEFILFKRLTKFCADVPGIATASIRTILKWVKAIDFTLGASESSFQRMKRKAIKLGILEVKQTNRKNNSTSSNLWIFKRFVANQPTIDTPRTNNEQAEPAPIKGRIVKQLTPLKASIISKTNNQYISKRTETIAGKNKQETSFMDHSFTKDYVPTDFVMAVKPFFDDAKVIEEYWKMVRIYGYQYRNLVPQEAVLSLAVDSFKQMIRKHKQGLADKPIGYFVGVLSNKLEAAAVEIVKVDSEADRKNKYTISDTFKEMMGIKKEPLPVTI